jgi:hypothetical protein
MSAFPELSVEGQVAEHAVVTKTTSFGAGVDVTTVVVSDCAARVPAAEKARSERRRMEAMIVGDEQLVLDSLGEEDKVFYTPNNFYRQGKPEHHFETSGAKLDRRQACSGQFGPESGVQNTDGKNPLTLSNANLGLLKIMRCAKGWNCTKTGSTRRRGTYFTEAEISNGQGFRRSLHSKPMLPLFTDTETRANVESRPRPLVKIVYLRIVFEYRVHIHAHGIYD